MNYKYLNRKQRITEFENLQLGRHLQIGTVVFGANPVLAQEQANAAGANTETVEPGQGLMNCQKKRPQDLTI